MLVGDRHRRHAQLAGFFDQLLDPDRAVDQGVFGVEVEVDEGGGISEE
jgi:hypothetical protein